jgi:hypothetical protein
MKKEEKKKCFEFLERYGYLEYGKIIPKEIFEEIFRADFDNTWAFLGPFLSFKEYLEEAGYLCTSENLQPGCLRIFDADEMADRSNVIIKNMVRRMRKLQACFTNAKVQEFSSKEYQKHLHTSNKVSMGLHSLESNLAEI